MSGFALVASIRGSRVAAAGTSPTRVQKTAKTLDCGAHLRDDRDCRDDRSGNDRRHSSRRGTIRDVPLWDGPRFRPAFVAQVIAQVIGNSKPDALSAMSAYARPWHGRANLLLDDSI